MKTVALGDRIKLRYELRLSDGRVVESSGDEGVRLVIGDGEISEPLEQLLLGLEQGAEGSFHISASQFMFGTPSDEAIQTLNLDEFDEIEPRPGQLIEFETPAGHSLSGRVESVHGDQVVVDFNHPLVGRDVEFDVAVLDIEKGGEA